MAEQQITGLGARTAPLNRTTKDSELFQLLAVRATFDGTGAAGSFVPTVEIVSDSGRLVGTFPLAASLAAGESADVTFAPFLRSGVGLTGIYYDLVNSGDWLEIHTTTDLAPGSGGINLTAPKGGVWIISQGQANSQFVVESDFVIFDLGNNIYRIINASLIDLNGTSFSAILDDDWTLQTTHTSVGVDALDNVNINLANGKPLTVSDHLGNPIFRVDENGDLHGKTGKALVFDL